MKSLKFTLLILGIGLVFSVSGQSNSALSIDTVDLDSFIIANMQNFHVPGLSACVVKDGSVIWNNNYGYMNLQDSTLVGDSTLFNVFSISKSITTACVMQLVDKQIVGLDENINNFLPFQVSNPHNGIDSITPRMLMNHTSTINDWNFNNFVVNGDPAMSLGYFMENYLSATGNFYNTNNFYNQVPGTGYNYDNYGMALLGYLIEPLTGISFHQYVRDSLLTPLGMNSSAWFLNELNVDSVAVGYDYAGGTFTANAHRGHPAYPGIGLRTSALELANFVIMLLNNGSFNNQTILSLASINSMTTVQNSNLDKYGLGMYKTENYGSRTVWGHNGGGGGYAAEYYFCKDEESGVVVTTNSEQHIDTIVEYLFDYALNYINIVEAPQACNLEMNIYPNPATDIVNIHFDLKKGTEVSLIVRNIIGQDLKHIPLGMRKTGAYQLNCNEFSSGIYFITLQSGSGRVTKKLVIS
ncbi:MAG: serine hydrolase [Bacteroidales bacterium]|nr:serine hydrolase [Bacteroidales bacterium]MCF8454310.1 serine hydrolase [Bacteroidales bacterium]